jgi:HEAT repeat protein
MYAARHTDKLIEMAQNEKDPELRRRAVERLGVMNPEKTGPALVSLYANEKDKAIRKTVIEALFDQDNAKALLEIARKETDVELKKKIVEHLANMKKSKEAADFLMELLNK